jgi:hypothetical protein
MKQDNFTVTRDLTRRALPAASTIGHIKMVYDQGKCEHVHWYLLVGREHTGPSAYPATDGTMPFPVGRTSSPPLLYCPGTVLQDTEHQNFTVTRGLSELAATTAATMWYTNIVYHLSKPTLSPVYPAAIWAMPSPFD